MIQNNVKIANATAALNKWQAQSFPEWLGRDLLGVSPRAAYAVLHGKVIAVDARQCWVQMQVSSLSDIKALREVLPTLRGLLLRHGVRKLLVSDSSTTIQISTRTIQGGSSVQVPRDISERLNGIQIAEMRIDLPVLRVISEVLSHPDRGYGLVLADTEKQTMLSEGSARIILGEEYAGLTTKQIQARLIAATRLRREEYFWLPDLHEFRRDIRQLLTPDGSSTLELRPRIQARDGKWYRYTHQYRAVTDEEGTVYQLGRSLGVEEVPTPV